MTHSEFFRALKDGNLKGPYLFTGEEQFVKEKAMEQLRARYNDGALGDFNCQAMESPGAEDIISAGETLPFMAEQKLLIIRDCPLLRLGGRAVADETEQGEALAKWLPGPMSTLMVFYQRGETDKRKKVYQALTKCGTIVIFNPLPDTEMHAWLRAELKRRDRSMTPGAQRLLPLISGRMLSDLYQQLDKLCTYAQGEIAESDVEAVATRTVDYDVFEMVDLASRGDTDRVLRMYRSLLEQGQSPLGILVLTARNIRNCLKVTRLMEQGQRYAVELARLIGLPVFATEKVIVQAKGFTEVQLIKALYRCADTDWAIKSGQEKEEGAVERWLIDFSGKLI